jgi:flagellar biosynthesis protein FlhG
MADQAAGLRQQLSQSVRQPATGTHQGASNTLTIVGGKGGVGKTALATSLAIASHRSGKKTLLIDGDLGLANADIIMGVNPSGTLADCLLGGLPAQHAIATTRYGPDLLPAASGRAELSNLTDDHTERLLMALQAIGSRYDRVLIDTAAGIGQETLALAGMSHAALAVTTPDPTAMTDVYAQLKLLATAHPDQELHLVVNQVTSDEEAMKVGTKLRDICARFMTTSLHVDGGIPLDQDAKMNLRRRQPMNATQNLAATAIGRLEKRLTAIWK